ncbi:hypothetical protein M0802_015129 [Mischocyttarus mexicanus]|nr:hypothetical protein M0802_015129 [Mischocyttarus mexicanus]
MRFEQILTFFHLNDNTERIVPQDRLSKIKPLLNYISSKYQALYILKQELASDKAMIPFRGLISYRTYNPAKITKYGILIRMLCENTRTTTITAFLQSSYCSEKKTLVCGTIRENRGLPKVLLEKSKSLHTGEMTFLRKGPYNKHMKKVDRADQYLANSSILRKIAFFLINYTLFNAYKMYCTYRPESKIRYKKFLLEIAREWITVVSKECSTAPDTSVRSQTAHSKDSPSRLSGQLKDYVLEKIVSARRTNPTKACRLKRLKSMTITLKYRRQKYSSTKHISLRQRG